ncbi:MAG TPA: PGPGW domain-containing protein [Candidatus Omnitrophota bacterium]|nr:PGPGW domain-containing protein [Candidatus Omnitrophota bacterium]
MTANTKKTLKIAAGILFLVLGVAGLALPFLQGVLFLAVGLVILAPHWPWAGRQVARLRRRWPHRADQMDALVKRVKATIRRATRRR